MSADDAVRVRRASAAVGVRDAVARALGIGPAWRADELDEVWIGREYGRVNVHTLEEVRRAKRNARSTGFHEASHALVAYFVGMRVSHAAFAPDDSLGGFMSYTVDRAPGIGRVVARLATLYAGEEAEVRYTGDRATARASAASDRKAAAEVLVAAKLSTRASTDAERTAHVVVGAVLDTCWPAVRELARRLLQFGRVDVGEIQRLVWHPARRPPDNTVNAIRTLVTVQ